MNKRRTPREIKTSWEHFKEEYTNEILPIYLNHEETFDYVGYHGRRHITRSLLFAEIIGRFYFLLGEDLLDFDGIRTAVSFHDSAREGNGMDYWEVESGENCKEYLLDKGRSKVYADKISNMILQKKIDIETREEQIVYDVDVIEIIRVFPSRDAFRIEELYFLGENELHKDFPTSILKLRNQFLAEFWDFIEATEDLSPSNESFVNKYIQFFQADRERYSLMNSLYDFEWKPSE